MQSETATADTGATKHSRSCENCSRAKTKCLPQVDGQSSECARCFRLKKSCVVPPRAIRKKRSPNVATQTAQLEQKIESLVSLLSAAQQNKLGLDSIIGIPPVSESPVNSSENLWINNPNSCVPYTVTSNIAHSRHADTPPDSTSSGQDTTISSPFTETARSDHKTPDELIQIFRDQFAIHYPYAVLSPDVTASQLQETRPWLYRIVIMATTLEDRTQQLKVADQIITEIITGLVLRGERSLDMLQALLVYISWCYYFTSLTPNLHSSAIFQLALALVYDLKLNRPLSDDEGGPGELLANAKKRAWEGTPELLVRETANRTLEERRALLFAFYLTSVLSTCTRKFGSLQNLAYLEHNCEIISSAPESETDIILVALVRLQSAAESMIKPTGNPISSPEIPRAPNWMHTISVRTEMQRIFDGVPPQLQNDYYLQVTYHSAQISILESSIRKPPHPDSILSHSKRLDMLYTCLMAAKSLLDCLFTAPDSLLHHLSITNMSQLGHGMSTLFKLSFLEATGWDVAAVRETVDLANYFDQIISRISRAGQAFDNAQLHPCTESFLTVCAKRMTHVKGWYEARLALERQATGTQGQVATTVSNEALNDSTFDYLNEVYWQEIMGDYQYIPMQQ